jgi:DNA-directed RNA polymerase subunit A"
MSNQSQTSYLSSLPKRLLEEIEEVARRKKLTNEQKEKLRKEVEKAYSNSRFEPGEAFGIVAAQSISEPATQMSLDYNQKILVKNGGLVKPVKIGEFVDEILRKFFGHKKDGSEIVDLPENVEYFVYSLDQDEKLKLKRIKSVVRHKAPRKLLKIRTASGRVILATDHHSFVIRKNNKITPISGKLLKVNDRIPVMKYLPEHSIDNIVLSQNLQARNLLQVNEQVSEYPAPSKLPDRVKLDGKLGLIIGVYLAEGEAKKNFTEFSKGYDGNTAVLSAFLKQNCGTNSKNKRVPFFAFSAKEEFVRALLQAYFYANDSIRFERDGMRVSSESKELSNGIALLLARFGIFCSKSEDGKTIWISYEYARKLFEKIGTLSEVGKEKLLKMISRWEKIQSKEDEIIPGIGELLCNIAKKLKFPTKYVNNFAKKQQIGRSTLEKYVKLFEKISKKKKVDVSKELAVLKRALNSDVVWDRIERIEYVDYNLPYVYDISVDGLETFTTFEGIITHNTMRTYHIAGTAGIKVTYGMPRLIEIFDAKKEPETPMMTIYFKKQFNTSEFAERFAEEIIEKKVMHIIKRVSLNLSENSIDIELQDKKKIPTFLKVVKENFKDLTVKVKTENISITPKEDLEVKDLQKLKGKILNTKVSGIENIVNAVVLKEGENWIVNTIGSNLEAVLAIKEVDEHRTFTNNIHETAKVLGIEAARNLIIREALKTMQEQALDVNIRHVMLVADIMTFRGDVRPIGRYGVAGAKTSILARAAFEETIKHLVRASIRKEVDNFKGIFENVMIGQVIPSGTGMFDLIARFAEEK